MLRRRLNVDEKRYAVGDSAGDIGMFEEAAHAICFNPWDERLTICKRSHSRRTLHWFYNRALRFFLKYSMR